MENRIALLKNKVKTTRILNAITITIVAILFIAMYVHIDTQAEEIKNLSETAKLQSKWLEQRGYKIITLEEDAKTLNLTLDEKESKIQEQEKEIEELAYEVSYLSLNLKTTTGDLEKTQTNLKLAEAYKTRVEQGIDRSKAYNLLSDIDTTKLLIRNDNITPIHSNPTDEQIWQNARDIYAWIGANFFYCGDKTIRIGDYSVTQFQYWSPNELLANATTISEANRPCGDCDDKAHLFAGMMYAAGVPYEKVFVVCGTVPDGGHCWNQVIINDQTYRVDPVCSWDSATNSLFGFIDVIQRQVLPTTPDTLDCFSSYEGQAYYNPNKYTTFN